MLKILKLKRVRKIKNVKRERIRGSKQMKRTENKLSIRA
jgi:hypothetical protein